MKRFLISLAVLAALLSVLTANNALAQIQSEQKIQMSELYNSADKLKTFLAEEYPKMALEQQLRVQHDLQDLLVQSPARDDAERESMVRMVTRLAFKSADQASFRRLMAIVKPRLSINDQETLLDEVVKLTLEQSRENTTAGGAPNAKQTGLVPPATKADTICSGLLTVTAASQYVAPSTGYAVAYPKPLFQTEFGVSCARGRLEFGGAVWNSQGFHRQLWGSNAEEVDVTAFLAKSFSHERRIEFRYSYLDLGPLNESDYNNFSVRYSRTHHLRGLVVTPYAKVDAYFRTNKLGDRSGAYLVLGGEVTKELGKGWSAGANLHVAYDPYGTFGYSEQSVLYRQDYSVKYTHGSWSFAPTLTFSGANDNERPGKVAASIVLTRNFSFGKH